MNAKTCNSFQSEEIFNILKSIESELTEIDDNSESAKEIKSVIETFAKQIEKISKFVDSYDSMTKTKANGFRSFLKIAKIILEKLLQEISANKRAWFTFTSDPFAAKEFQSIMKIIQDLITINEFLLEMNSISPESLLPDTSDVAKIEPLARRIAGSEFKSFFGHLCGFYLTGDAATMLKSMVFCMASYGDVYQDSFIAAARGLIQSFGGLKYLISPETIAGVTLEYAKDKQLDFAKSFYNFPENYFVHQMSSKRHPAIQSNYLISIPPALMKIPLDNGSIFEVPIPSAHIGPKPIMVRLMCPFKTKDMYRNCNCLFYCRCVFKETSSDTIVLHMHGGGYVSQTSKSHEGYLKKWCIEWQVPILSVDYSLAPEAGYPRPLEEVFYAYCWMRQNFKMLGTSGQKVIVGGNSSGANLAMGLFQLCVKHSVPIPDMLFLGYPSLLCQMCPSPSRLISLIDPLVMFPFLLRCFNAYIDPNYKSDCPRSFQEEVDASFNLNPDPLLSPFFMPEEMLAQSVPIFMFASDMDPCLDETVEFSNKLIKAGAKDVQLEIIEGLPHGFLSYGGMSSKCQKAVDKITTLLKIFFKI